MPKITLDETLIDKIVDGDPYEIWTAYHPEVGLPSYAVFHKHHKIIEHFNPNFINALNVRDEFLEWIKARDEKNPAVTVKEFDGINA